MFDVYCPGHQARVLLGSRSIETITNTEAGIEIQWRCRCGGHGTLVTGRRTQDAKAA